MLPPRPVSRPARRCALVAAALLLGGGRVGADEAAWQGYMERARELLAAKQTRQAERHFLAAAKAARDLDDQRRRYLESLGDLAELYRAEGRADRAVKALSLALEAQVRVHGKDHPALASTFFQLARAEEDAGQPFEAAAHLESAAALLADRPPKGVEQAARLRLRRSELLEANQQPVGALAALEGALGVLEPVLGPGSPELLQLLTRKLALEVALGRADAAHATRGRVVEEHRHQAQPDHQAWARELRTLAEEGARRGEHAAARQRWKALRVAQVQAGNRDGEPRILRGEGEAALALGQSGEAVGTCQAAAAAAQAAGPELLAARLCAARGLAALGRREDALRELVFAAGAVPKGDPALRPVLELRIQLLEALGRKALAEKELPALLEVQKAAGVQGAALAAGLVRLARLELGRGHLPQASAAVRQALDGLDGGASAARAEALGVLGECLRRAGDLAQGRVHLEEALEMRRTTQTLETPGGITDAFRLGLTLHALGDLDAATAGYGRALELAAKAGRSRHAEVAPIWNARALLAQSRGRWKDARRDLENARDILEENQRNRSLEYATYCNALGLVLLQGRQRKSARAAFEKALPLFERLKGRKHAETVAVVNALAALAVAREDWVTARRLYPRVIAGLELAYGADHEALATPLFNYGTALLHARGRKRKAREQMTRALAIAEAQLGPDHADTRVFRDTVARFR